MTIKDEWLGKGTARWRWFTRHRNKAGLCVRCGKGVPYSDTRTSWKDGTMKTVKRRVCLACIEKQIATKLYGQKT